MPLDRQLTASRHTRYTSGILIRTHPAHLADVVTRLEAEPEIEVHHLDPSTGRIIVVTESNRLEVHTDRVENLRRIPHVMLAEPVYTRRDELTEPDHETA